MEYLYGCITATRHIMRKVAAMKNKLVKWILRKQYHHKNISSRGLDLVYDKSKRGELYLNISTQEQFNCYFLSKYY